MPLIKTIRRFLTRSESTHRPVLQESVRETPVPFWVVITLFPLQLLVIAIMLSRFWENERSAIYVAMLFALPPLLQVAGIILIKSRRLRVFYALVSLLSSGSYLSCWIYYSMHGEVREYVSWTCLLLTGLLVLIAFLIATATFGGGSVSNCRMSTRQFANEIGTSPSGEILFFLAFFISVAYLISFSLAFNDRYRTINGRLPGLRSDIIIDSDDYGGAQGKFPAQESPVKKWLLVFRPGSAVLESDSPHAKMRPEQLRLRDDDVTRHNGETLDEIVRFLGGFEGRQTVRVTLIGRSDDVGIERHREYLSNYELAEARAQSVRLALEELVSKTGNTVRNLEWLIVPLSESPEVRAETRRSVEVSVQPLGQSLPDFLKAQSGGEARLLSLIEYIYFGMYTITTTGYGDLKPATSYAMFVCTLANFYAVFFLVIFFNVLLSPKRRRVGKAIGRHGSHDKTLSSKESNK